MPVRAEPLEREIELHAGEPGVVVGRRLLRLEVGADELDAPWPRHRRRQQGLGEEPRVGALVVGRDAALVAQPHVEARPVGLELGRAGVREARGGAAAERHGPTRAGERGEKLGGRLGSGRRIRHDHDLDVHRPIVAEVRRSCCIDYRPGVRQGFDDTERAAALEAADPLPTRRAEFVVPPWPGGAHPEWAYFAGNSLGLQPRTAAAAIERELSEWGRVAVEGWFEAAEPWLEYVGSLSAPLGRLVGASADEVVAMNTLTVNLHLLLATFYRPAGQRTRILIEDGAFPSDSHAVASQAALHGLDPAGTVVRLAPRPGEDTLRTDEIVAAIEREGDRLAVVWLGAVNYLTGEVLDVAEITRAAHAVGAVCGWDLAHSIGNVPMSLHDHDVDFAVWCNYKYVNAGPGAPGGAFVHARHASDRTLPRLAGWWGVDRAERFRMESGFVPAAGAEGWAVSTPPILAFAPLRAALAQFDEVGVGPLRERSIRLTGFLEELLDEVAGTAPARLVTPRDPACRGCQLSVRVPRAKAVAGRLRAEHGVVCDFREPDVLRFAPVPLSSTYEDCRRGAAALGAVLA